MHLPPKTSFDTTYRAPRAQPLRMTGGPAGSRILLIRIKTRSKETVSLSDPARDERDGSYRRVVLRMKKHGGSPQDLLRYNLSRSARPATQDDNCGSLGGIPANGGCARSKETVSLSDPARDERDGSYRRVVLRRRLNC